jgi:hypothetical protein
MKTIKNNLLLVLFGILFMFASQASASVVPTLSLSPVDNTMSKITVYGDPNSLVDLHFGGSSAYVGSTDQSGYFSTTFGSNTHNLAACNQTAYVIINNQQSLMIPWSASGNSTCSTNTVTNGYPIFSQNNVTLNVGQSLSIGLSGNGGYNIASNSNSSIVAATINGNNVNIYANAFGGATLNVCESDGQCSNLVIVVVNTGAVTQTNTANNPLVSFSSFTLSSSNVNGNFLSPGSTISLSFSANQPNQVNTAWASFAGKRVGLSGNSPYTSSYIVTGNEGSTIPVVLVLNDFNGRAAQMSMTLNQNNISQVSTPAPTVVTTANNAVANNVANTSSESSNSSASAAKYKFSTSIKSGSAGKDVTELQTTLKKLNFYNGPINGKFGPLTETAVKKFQKAKKLTQTGALGPATRNALNK